MKIQSFTSAAVAVALSSFAFTTYANNENNMGGYENRNWTPQPPQNRYWQAPDWSSFSFSPNAQPLRPGYAPPPPGYNNAHRQQAMPTPRPAPSYRPPNQQQNQQQNRNRPNPNMQRPNPNMAPPPNAHRGAYRGNTPPPPNGPYGRPSRPDNGASAFNVPGYHRYNNNNDWNNNKFWGRSGPNKWMNPNKRNMEQGWDDMINAPSRMGEMPGGWSAPEVSVPNPIDMGDQIQDNIKDLPEQIRNMDVGN